MKKKSNTARLMHMLSQKKTTQIPRPNRSWTERNTGNTV